jgi:transcriptional regulatory protein LevR
MWREGVLERLTEIVKLKFSHKNVLYNFALKEVHQHSLKRSVTILQGNKIFGKCLQEADRLST